MYIYSCFCVSVQNYCYFLKWEILINMDYIKIADTYL